MGISDHGRDAAGGVNKTHGRLDDGTVLVFRPCGAEDRPRRLDAMREGQHSGDLLHPGRKRVERDVHAAEEHERVDNEVREEEDVANPQPQGADNEPERIGRGHERDDARHRGEKLDEETRRQVFEAIRASYNEQQDIRYGAARGWVDRIIEPERTREELVMSLRIARGFVIEGEFRTGVLQV